MNEKSSGSRFRKQRLTAVGTRCADHVTPFYPQKLALTSSTGGGRSVGIVRVRTKATEFSFRCPEIKYVQNIVISLVKLEIEPCVGVSMEFRIASNPQQFFVLCVKL